MRYFLKSTSFKILLALLIVLLAGIVTAASYSSGSSPVTAAVSAVFSPLQKASSYIAAKFDKLAGGFISSSSYMNRVDELENQVADYQGKLVDYEKIKKKLESYEKFLEVKEKNPDFKFVAGTVIGRDPADMFHSFVLNCGSNDGVKVNDPVIHGEYLVGKVSEVTPTTAIVLTIVDPKLNTAAYEIRTGEIGYTSTTAKLGTEGILRLSNLPKDTSVAPGGIVCTSGIGGFFPRGLIIGTVSSINKEESDISYYAEIKPELDISEIGDAFVITDFEGKGDA